MAHFGEHLLYSLLRLTTKETLILAVLQDHSTMTSINLEEEEEDLTNQTILKTGIRTPTTVEEMMIEVEINLIVGGATGEKVAAKEGRMTEDTINIIQVLIGKSIKGVQVVVTNLKKDTIQVNTVIRVVTLGIIIITSSNNINLSNSTITFLLYLT